MSDFGKRHIRCSQIPHEGGVRIVRHDLDCKYPSEHEEQRSAEVTAADGKVAKVSIDSVPRRPEATCVELWVGRPGEAVDPIRGRCTKPVGHPGHEHTCALGTWWGPPTRPEPTMLADHLRQKECMREQWEQIHGPSNTTITGPEQAAAFRYVMGLAEAAEQRRSEATPVDNVEALKMALRLREDVYRENEKLREELAELRSAAPTVEQCWFYDEDDNGVQTTRCDGRATHYSCTEIGDAPNVCAKHKCRCKQPGRAAAKTSTLADIFDRRSDAAAPEDSASAAWEEAARLARGEECLRLQGGHDPCPAIVRDSEGIAVDHDDSACKRSM